MTDIISDFKSLIDTHIIESKPIDEIIYNEFIEKIYKVKHNKYMSNYIKDKQTNNFEMTSFSNERRLNSYLKPKSLYTEDWNSDARGAISRGLHKKPF